MSFHIKSPRNVQYYRKDLWDYFIGNGMNGNYDDNLTDRISNVSYSMQYLELLFQLELETTHIIYLTQIHKTSIVEIVGILEALFRIYLIKIGKKTKAVNNKGFSYISITKKEIYKEALSFVDDDFKEKLNHLIELRHMVHHENSSSGSTYSRIGKRDYNNSLRLLFNVLKEFIPIDRLYTYRIFESYQS